MKKITILCAAFLCSCIGLFAQTTALDGGIIAASHYIIQDTHPVTLRNVVPASGGSAPIEYSWELSEDNSNWGLIPGIFSDSYGPCYVTDQTYFRRKATSGNQTAYSNTIALYRPQITNGTNYIVTYTYTAPNNSDYSADVDYYNDLGYPSQNVQIGASPDMGSIVTPVYQDTLLRESRKYLPYATNGTSGHYRSNVFLEQAAYYNARYGSNEGSHSYTENFYEASPLNRESAIYKAGNVFRADNKKQLISYDTNTGNEVIRFIADSISLTLSGYCRPYTLFKVETTDEDGRAVATYKDYLGHVILERSVDVSLANSSTFDTYYVYDDCGNLRYVLPPELSKTIALRAPGVVPDTILTELAYVYKYDGRNRCVEKRMPGSQPTYMIYDNGDRLVMSQDGNMRVQDQWLYTEYDKLNRPTRQSIIKSSEPIPPSTLQHSYTVATLNNPYIPLISDFTECTMLTTTVYDAYVYEDETVLIPMNQIPVGTNIRGWIFKVTHTDLSLDLPVDEFRNLNINGQEWMTLFHYDGDNVNLKCNSDIQATVETFYTMNDDGGWTIDDGYTFTIKDDQDYIVTSNNLPRGDETNWGFERIVRIRPVLKR